ALPRLLVDALRRVAGGGRDRDRRRRTGPLELVARLRGRAHLHRAPRARGTHASRSRRGHRIGGGGALRGGVSLSPRARGGCDRRNRRRPRGREKARAPMSNWLLIAAVAIATFLLRASFIVFADPRRFPHAFRQALIFVPPAVLAAFVAPGLLMPQGALDLGIGNLRLTAGVIA